MSLTLILGIALITAAAAAVNGIIGSIFLLLIWLWLNAGVIPMLRGTPDWTWQVHHIILPLIVFLLLWQWRLRGKIGPQTGFRDLLRRRRSSFA